jgi:hypothetical protein
LGLGVSSSKEKNNNLMKKKPENGENLVQQLTSIRLVPPRCLLLPLAFKLDLLPSWEAVGIRMKEETVQL